MSRKERLEQMGDRAKNFTNVYLKNFSEEINDEKLRDMMEPYGKIISARVMTTEDGRGRGFGFVSFEDHEAAAKVCQVSSVWAIKRARRLLDQVLTVRKFRLPTWQTKLSSWLSAYL